jgi:hypothetical protein
MKKFIVAAVLLSASATAAVSISRPVTISRPITISRPVPVQAKPAPVRPAPVSNVAKSGSNVSTAALAATTAVIATTALNQANAQTVSVADEDADTRLANVNVPLLTICSEEQLVRAHQWQQYCHAALSGLITDYCAVLSYQRYCDPATVEEIKGKQPARPHYINTYMR